MARINAATDSAAGVLKQAVSDMHARHALPSLCFFGWTVGGSYAYAHGQTVAIFAVIRSKDGKIPGPCCSAR